MHVLSYLELFPFCNFHVAVSTQWKHTCAACPEILSELFGRPWGNAGRQWFRYRQAFALKSALLRLFKLKPRGLSLFWRDNMPSQEHCEEQEGVNNCILPRTQHNWLEICQNLFFSAMLKGKVKRF